MTAAEQWIQQGEEKGRHEGEAGLLLWQLEQRFGPNGVAPYRERVEQASAANIRTWSGRLLTATTIDAVFTDG